MLLLSNLELPSSFLPKLLHLPFLILVLLSYPLAALLGQRYIRVLQRKGLFLSCPSDYLELFVPLEGGCSNLPAYMG